MDLKCPKCGKTFSTKEEMVEHMKVHAKGAIDSMKSGLKLQEIKKPRNGQNIMYRGEFYDGC